jgi:archaellum biogenesis protein FlaJ (TadC family)
LINQQSSIPAENQKILLERTKLFENISNLDKKSLAILENRTEIISNIVENSLLNRDLLSRLANKIESLDKKVDDIVKSNQMVTPK